MYLRESVNECLSEQKYLFMMLRPVHSLCCWKSPLTFAVVPFFSILMIGKLEIGNSQIILEHLDGKKKNQLSGCFVYITSDHVALHRQNIRMTECFTFMSTCCC